MLNKQSFLTEAVCIAKQNLLQCMTSHGIIAGTHHFVDLWARDSLFAAFGSDALSARATIEMFLRFQRKDGLIPYCVMRSKTSIAKYFGKPTLLAKPKAEFRSRQSGGLVLDGGLMTIIAAYEYAKRSGNRRYFSNPSSSGGAGTAVV
jgi:glycogen debranching enzyme